jgi:hypothetical protein
MSRLALAAFAMVAVSAGCSHGTKRVQPKPLTACERARATALREPRPNALRGDVDGDGRPDAVAIVRVPTAPDRCRAFLIVKALRRTFTRPLQGNAVPDVPRLNGLAAIVPGRLHIVVTTWQGASTAFARLFAIRGGRILALAAPTGDGTFPYEGSVTHFDGVDCAVETVSKTIVASGYFEKGAAGPPFGFVRHVYSVRTHPGRGDRLVRAYTRTGTAGWDLSRRPFDELREPQPFPSCMRVRAE